MKKILTAVMCQVLIANVAFAAGIPSSRSMQIANDQVKAWETTIQPGKGNGLKMHRHDHDRVVVTFDDVKLKVVNDKGQSHIMAWKKNTPYFLSKDIANEKHTEENLSVHAVKF